MVITPSNPISGFQSPALPVRAQIDTAASGQPFTNQFAAAIAAPVAAPPAQPPVASTTVPVSPPASSSPAILSVTILPWGRSIAYASTAAAAASLPPAATEASPAAAVTTAPSAQTPTSTAANAAAASPPPALPASQQAINALSEILSGYGINPAALGLSYSEQFVAGPTGAYTNRMITAKFPSGKSQDYSADLTLKNPTVAAVEIMAMLGRRIVA